MHEKEVTCTTFLGIACRDIREGRTMHALAIFQALAKTNFTRKKIALQGEAVALAKTGQSRDAFTESRKKFKKIVDMSTEPTVYKADILRNLAEVSIVLQVFDGLDQVLQEAADIYDHQGLPKAQGSIVHLQAIVALWNQDYKAAMDHLTWATTLSEIKIPDSVPDAFSIEAAAEPTSRESSMLALASSRG